ncbi:recombinase family protein [Arthrobacter sp. ISL-28]|uniref:recombinase family protein n=1 Tax=Arthrobacter sp. ISL-28 TaxID=2819108 RepID=UPI001BEA3E7C|nr:recombinase family protein [Arthrobacter sp. ISL-28]MBT2523265.1 recombinase family protein [Arthrobacter sp. ISL-28]
MTTSAAIYSRQSEDVSEGIANQRKRCRSLIEARGWTVGKEYTDNDTSAAKRRGPGTAWHAMLDDLRSGVADVVVAVDLDRLLRSTRDLIEITDTGARVLTVDGEIDLTTADGEFRATMLAGIARFEIRRKSERQRRANESRTANGRPVPGRRRYGYETDGVTPREAEAVIVRRLFAHVAEGGSVRSAVTWLKEENVDPAPGKIWVSRRVRDLLLNPHYSGKIKHLGAVIDSDFVTPIVDADLAQEVAAILNDPSRRTTPGPKPKHLLSGLTNCGVCGAPIFYMRTYLCRVSAGHTSITKNRLENRVRDEIAKAFISGGPALFPASPNGSSISALIKAHEKNTASVAATIQDRDEGLVPVNMARARLIELRGAREAIEAELERARSEKGAASALLEIAQGLIVKPSFEMHEYAEMKETVLARFDDLDLDKQREIVRALFYIEVRPGRDIGRVWIEHKLAAHLNPDADADARYYDEDADRVSADALHPRWAGGAPMTLDSSSAAFMDAEAIVRDAYAAE